MLMESKTNMLRPKQTHFSKYEAIDKSEETIINLFQKTPVLRKVKSILSSSYHQDPTRKPVCEQTTTALELRYSKKRVGKKHYLYAVQETIAFAIAYSELRIREFSQGTPYVPLTSVGRFNHYIVGPFFRWFGQNERTVMGASLGSCSIQEADGSTIEAINGGSHNYAGFYGMSSLDEAIHRKCLDSLPISDTKAVSILLDTMTEQLKLFFGAQSCVSTSTGYGSNMLGIPAVANDGWLIIVDEKSHNSIFTGAYASRAKHIKRFKHNDMEALREILCKASKSREYKETLVIVEGLYSMDGTIPPLSALWELKKVFPFLLYVDEAHSFGSIGRTGRGCLELWNDEHPGSQLPDHVIDVRSAVLSKAVGGLGGFVSCTDGRFEERLHRRAKELEQCGESLTTATILMTLSFLRQPQRLRSNLCRLRNISEFCHEELERQGVQVYGDQKYKHLPMLPVRGGRPSKASELSQALRKNKVVASPVSAPAVEIWESRVRITLSASYTDEEVNRLVSAIVSACRNIGLCETKNTSALPNYFQHLLTDEELLGIEQEHQEAYAYLNHLLDEQIDRFALLQKEESQAGERTSLSPRELKCGHDARKLHGIGSGSARWILGTFPTHLSVEEILSGIYRQEAAITYPDSGLGVMSTIAGLCRPILGYRKHYFLLPATFPRAVDEGTRIASKSSKTTFIRYADIKSLVPILQALISKDRYLTLFIGLDDMLELSQKMATSSAIRGSCTVLVNDSASLRPSTQKPFQLSDVVLKTFPSARVLISGSFYEQINLPGGYLAGDATLIEELRYTSRCYMFTTSPMPWIMAIIRQKLSSQFQSSSETTQITRALGPSLLPMWLGIFIGSCLVTIGVIFLWQSAYFWNSIDINGFFFLLS